MSNNDRTPHSPPPEPLPPNGDDGRRKTQLAIGAVPPPPATASYGGIPEDELAELFVEGPSQFATEEKTPAELPAEGMETGAPGPEGWALASDAGLAAQAGGGDAGPTVEEHTLRGMPIPGTLEPPPFTEEIPTSSDRLGADADADADAEPEMEVTHTIEEVTRVERPPRSGGILARAPSTTPYVAEAIDLPPLVERNSLNDHGVFRSEAHRLARSREWQKLTALTRAAIDHASWVTLPETRATLLLDLARIHRDRLSDPAGAEDAFQRLAKVDPTNEDALEYLAEVYQGRGDWRAVYDLFSAAIEPTWDPNQRLAWTRETSTIAAERLRSPDLAIEAWERLERLGDAVEETYEALSEMYRRAGRWARLAQFLGKRAATLQGPERIVLLREVAEAYLLGLRDHDQAAAVLDQILAERPDDILSLLAYARVLRRRGDWEALATLGARPLEGVHRSALLDFRRLIADALWSAGELDRAAAAHDRVLALDPNDADSLAAKEEYLTRNARWEELVQLLGGRAERATDDETRALLLGRAARLAEEKIDDPRLAAGLWERRVALPVGQLESHQALERIYEATGDLAGVARSLEGELALTRKPVARVELLRRLGEHSAHRTGNDARAEACWREIVSIVPDDAQSQNELMALHRRRGDFEALDRALSSQAWRATDREAVLGFWRAAAANIDDNINDPRRALRAWQRVLDLSPGDPQAMRALVAHHRALGQTRELIGALEAELRTSPDDESRVARGLEVARLWEAEGARLAALAAYERVLRHRATEPTALAGLSRLHTGKESGVATAAFDVAAAACAERGATDEQLGLLRRALDLIDPADKRARFYGLRRILWLSGRAPEVLAEVERAASEAGAWAELAAIHVSLAADAADPATRAAHRRALARIYEEQLADPGRAFLALQASPGFPVDDAEATRNLTRLADATSRHEDLLALAEASAGVETPLSTRRAMLRLRAEICEHKLRAPARAFAECARLLLLDPHDELALADVRRLAEGHDLWRELDALYAELWDRAASSAERIVAARARHSLRADKLRDPSGALDQLLLVYRLDPVLPGLVEQLIGIADREGAWDRVLPAIEGTVRAVGGSDAAVELHWLGELHEKKRNDRERAFALYADAFVLQPASRELDEDLTRLASEAGLDEPLARVYRLAAARAEDPARKLELYRRITALFEGPARNTEGALDVHRTILQLDRAALPSLEVVIEHHRVLGEWRELRDRLQQWADHAPEERQRERIVRWLELARLSRDQLDDPEAALTSYARVLDVDPANEDALAGVRSLGDKAESPRFELRRLRLELPRAPKERRVELLLACARLEQEQLDDPEAATETLRTLVAESGATGPGFDPLSSLLRQRGAFADLVDLIEERAAQIADHGARVALLEEAVAVCDEHLEEAPLARKERLYQRLLQERPDDAETRRWLLSLYREAGRHEELAGLLEEALDAARSGKGSPLDEEEQILFELELARLWTLSLGRPADAAQLLTAAAARRPDDDELLIGRAQLALRRGDFAAYLELRQQHAKRLPPSVAALVLCHLAEACDETPGQQLRVAGLYREARNLDPQNPSATEALKAIGRRAKNWRQLAALLPDPDEARLPFAERAARLRALGDSQLPGDPTRATDFYLRATVVDPDHFAAWDALAHLRAASGDLAGAYQALRASLGAWERAVAPAPSQLREHAVRIQRLADACRAAGDSVIAAPLSLRAYRLQPGFSTAALAVADSHFVDGDLDGAFALYDRILRERGAPLSDGERLHATFQRGAIAWRLQKGDHGVADLRAALRLDNLHAGALNTLAQTFTESGRVAAAIQHFVQSLLVEPEVRRRGILYARLGRLWEDQLRSADEAGVCYDLAIAAGIGESEVPGLMLRALQQYRRQGRSERALAVIEQLLPSARDPRALAALWTERGTILASAGDEERAVEAYDMALSYDPGHRGAITGLSQILERRGDWEQLAQIFEARLDSGTPEERVEALRALARMALAHLNDPARAERYLRGVVEIAPTREDFEQLLAIYGEDPARFEGRQAAIAGLLRLGGPYLPRMIEFGRLLVGAGERRWAWCLLSPLMTATLTDPTLKAMVLELRKEFEKTDNAPALSARTHLEVRDPRAETPLLELLAELDVLGSIGRSSADEAGAQGTGRLDERTAMGKAFSAVAARLGLEGTLLTRAQDLPEPCVILDGDTRHVVVRAELLQLLSLAETGFLFSFMLEQTRPGARLLASLPPSERGRLVPALYGALGVGERSAGDGALIARLERLIPEERRAGWAETLGRLLEARGASPSAQGEWLWQGVVETARRVGLVAAADLRFAARVITRLDETLPKMQTVGRIDDLDEFFASAAPVASLSAFAVTPAFGRALHGVG